MHLENLTICETDLAFLLHVVPCSYRAILCWLYALWLPVKTLHRLFSGTLVLVPAIKPACRLGQAGSDT